MVSGTASGPTLATVTVVGTDVDAVVADVGGGVGDVENRWFPLEKHTFRRTRMTVLEPTLATVSAMASGPTLATASETTLEPALADNAGNGSHGDDVGDHLFWKRLS